MRYFSGFIGLLCLPLFFTNVLSPQEILSPEAVLARIDQLHGTYQYDVESGSRIVAVDLSKTRATDEDMKALAQLTDLQRLDLSWTSVTGDGLRQLLPLKKLRSLNISRTMIREN